MLLLYIAGIAVRSRFGIRVVISNLSGETLRNVVVKVEERGNRYGFADLEPGDRKRIWVQPVTECHIKVEFVDAKNKPHGETIVGYAEGGYCGSATVNILPGNRVESSEHLEPFCDLQSWLGFM